MSVYARAVFLLDKDGQMLASEGEVAGIDTTSLASLTAGNIAATGGLAKLLGEPEFPVQVHEGERESIHISLIGGGVSSAIFPCFQLKMVVKASVLLNNN